MKTKTSIAFPRIAAALAVALVALTMVAASIANIVGMRAIETGRALLKKGKTPQAMKELGTALSAFAEHPVALDLQARCFVEKREYEKAAAALTRAVAASEEPLPSLRLLGQLKAQSPKEREEGLEMLLRAAALDAPLPSEAPLLWYITGELALKCNHPADALSAFRQSQEAGLSTPQLHRAIAKACTQLDMHLAADAESEF